MLPLPVALRSLVLLLALAACRPPPAHVAQPTANPGPRVQAHTDAAAVTAVLPVARGVLVGSMAGLELHVADGGSSTLVALDGIGVVALAPDGAGGAWVTTGPRLFRYRAEANRADEVVAPAGLAQARGLRALVGEQGGGVFVGGEWGVALVTAAGEWRALPVVASVKALAVAPDGTLLVGATDGLLVRDPLGNTRRLGKADGCALAAVDAILRTPHGTVVVVGRGSDGGAQLALQHGGQFSTFRLSPDAEILAAAGQGEEPVLAARGRLFALVAAGERAALERDGIGLAPVAGPLRRSPLLLRRLALAAPPDVTALALDRGTILAGTRTVGVARLALRTPRPVWLRRRDLVEGATDLTVACAAARDCYVATGNLALWHYDGRTFEPTEIGLSQVVLVVAQARHGGVLAIHQVPPTPGLRVSRLTAGEWNPIADVVIDLPGGVSGVSFAEISTSGLLWLGLRYLDAEGDERALGVAVVDLDVGVVTYHREVEGNDSAATGILPVPNDVVEIAFVPDSVAEFEVWFATRSGAAHIQGADLVLHSEAEGLESEVLRDVVATSGGLVFVAAGAGVGIYDGDRWRFPRGLKGSVNALALGTAGRLWLGTERGLAMFDGRRLRRVDAPAGLFTSGVEELAVDRFGRVYARSAEGIGIVEP